MAEAPIKELLFGRLASAGRFVTEEQIAECVQIQERYRAKGGPVPRMGEILSMKGYMTPEQVRAVLDGQHGQVEGLFGEIAVRWHFVDRETLEEALKLQRETDAAGEHRARIGEILVTRGAMRPHQVRAILEAQGKRIVHCSGCNARFNVAHYRPGGQVKCPKCSAVTVVGQVERHVADESPLDVVNTLWLAKEARPEDSEESDTAARRALAIGGYEMISRLGSDAAGVVCKARHLATGNLVALKIIRPGPDLSEGFMERFVEDTRQAVHLDHPNLKRIYEVGSDRGRCFLAEEFVEGQSLKRQLEQVGKLTPSDAVDIACQVAEALEYGHKHGVIHGDLRPSNIIIDGSGRARLAGLGVAKDAELNLNYFSRGATKVPFYLAPEQALDPGRTDARSDVYSLGAVLYHMVTGRPPYTGQGSLEVLMRLTQEPLIPPEQIVPDLSRQLAGLITAILAAEPDERPQTVTEVLGKLRSTDRTLRGGAAARAKPAASAERVPTPPQPAKPAVRDRLAAGAFAERRYARERFAERRKSKSAAPLVAGLAVAALALVALGWLIVKSINPGEPRTRTRPPERRTTSRPPVTGNTRPVDPDWKLFSEAVKYAGENVGDDAEIAARFKAFLARFPDSKLVPQAKERHRKHCDLAARRALRKVQNRRGQNEPKGDFLTGMTAIDAWLSKYTEASEDVLVEGRRIKQEMIAARNGFIAGKTAEIDKLIEAEDFAGARALVGLLRKVVSEKGAVILAESTRKIDEAEKALREKQRLDKAEQERRKREEAERLKKEAARAALAARFEGFRANVARLVAERNFEKALVAAAVAAEDFAGTDCAVKRAQMEEALQFYAVYHSSLAAGIKSGKGDPRLSLGSKEAQVVQIKGSLVVIKFKLGGQLTLPWTSFKSEEIVKLGEAYIDEKDGASLLGYAVYCSLAGDEATSAKYLAEAGKLGTRTATVKAVLDGRLLHLKTAPEKPEKPPIEVAKPEEPATPEKPAVDAGPGVLVLAPTKDARLAGHRTEVGMNYGAGPRLRTRALQSNSPEVVIMDFDRLRLKAFLAKRPGRRIKSQLILQVWEVYDGPARVEVATLDTVSEWAEGAKTTLKEAGEGESCFQAARKDLLPWMAADGAKMKDIKELLFDATARKVKTLLNSKGAEVDKDKKAVIIGLDDKLVRHLATEENCRGLVLLTRNPGAKVDFFSRERPGMGAKLVVTAGELGAPGPAGPGGPVEKPAVPKPPVPKTVPVSAEAGAPTEFLAEALSESEVQLTWKDNASDETGFEIQRCDRVADAFGVAVKAYNGKSRRRPAVVAGGFREGALVSADERDRWKYVPPLLRGRMALLTSARDRGGDPAGAMYEVQISTPCTIHLPVKTVDDTKMARDLGGAWTKTGLSCQSFGEKSWTIWKRTVTEAGTVKLPCHPDKKEGHGLCFAFSGPLRKTWRFLVDVKAGATTYKDTTLKPESVYYYRVRAIGAKGLRSPFSREFRVVTLTKLTK